MPLSTPWLASQAVISVSSMPGPWTKLDGEGAEGESIRVRFGGGEPYVSVQGEVTAKELVTERYVSAVQDATLLANLSARNYAPYRNSSITVTAIDSNGNTLGSPTTYHMCSIKGHELSGVDVNNKSEIRSLKVTWEVSD